MLAMDWPSWARECSPIPSKVIATCFALVSFAAALVLGLAAGNATDTIIWRATVIMVISWPVGYCVGSVAQHAVNRNIEAYKNARPLPSDLADRIATDAQGAGEELDSETVAAPGDEDAKVSADQNDLAAVTTAGVGD